MYLSTRLVDFVDLWGPVQLPYIDDAWDYVSEIIVSGGSIRKSLCDPSGKILPEEITCHWYSWTDPELSNNEEIGGPFSTMQLLLIGARSNLANSSSSVTFHVESSCRCENKYSDGCPKFELTTQAAYKKLDTVSAQISVTKVISFAIGNVWNVHPETTMKDVIIEEC